MQVPRAVLCLPTYNERENLEPMLRALGNKGVRVLVIDDSSPDGTGAILSNVVLSQTDQHAVFGGVVPEIAARAHVEALDHVIAKAMA